MAVIRFVSPIADLEITSVPAKFVNYVWDVDDSTPAGKAAAARMRYRGTAFHIEELGLIENPDDDTVNELSIAADIRDDSSLIGDAVGDRIETETGGLSTSISQLRQDVDGLLVRPGSGILVGSELPPVLDEGSLAARLRTY